MNERICEIALECARQLDWSPPSAPKEYTFSSAGLEKFAELIIRECFSKLEPYLDDQFINDIESELKEHFGVEE